MEYLEHGSSYEEIGIGWERYQQYLKTIEHDLPSNARSFATAAWHYDPAHHWCPHDSWVDELIIREESANGHWRRGISIHVRLLGAYHDGYATLGYSDVHEYQLGLDYSSLAKARGGHGDWLIDELRLSDRKLVVHEVSFRSGARWVIECGDLHYETSIPDVRDNR